MSLVKEFKFTEDYEWDSGSLHQIVLSQVEKIQEIDEIIEKLQKENEALQRECEGKIRIKEAVIAELKNKTALSKVFLTHKGTSYISEERERCLKRGGSFCKRTDETREKIDFKIKQTGETLSFINIYNVSMSKISSFFEKFSFGD